MSRRHIYTASSRIGRLLIGEAVRSLWEEESVDGDEYACAMLRAIWLEALTMPQEESELTKDEVAALLIRALSYFSAESLRASRLEQCLPITPEVTAAFENYGFAAARLRAKLRGRSGDAAA